MAISNELSSDVAVALLEQNKSPQERKQLKEIILQVHSALQKMSEETRADRFNRQLKNKAEALTDQRSLAVSE
jgi:predicted transcriptional regulator